MTGTSTSILTSLLDYHIHSKLCGHGVGELEDYVRFAVQSGLPEMGFSEHIFMYWLPETARDPELAMPENAFEPYVREVRRLQAAYPEIRLRLALEADFIVDHEAELRHVLGSHEWDYLIGSVHFIDGWGIDDARYTGGFDRWDIDQLYACYFDHVCRAAEDRPLPGDGPSRPGEEVRPSTHPLCHRSVYPHREAPEGRRCQH